MPAFDSKTAFEGLSDPAVEWLKELTNHNERTWFQDNKKRYHQTLRDPFVAFIEALSYRLEGSGLDLCGSKQSVFRINRDIRFSKDKTPYKTHMGGVLSYGGTKKDQRGILYFQFSVDGGFMAAGFYQPERHILSAIRDAIAEHPKQALSILTELDERQIPLQGTESLKRMPKGFESLNDEKIAPLLKMKGYIMKRPLSLAQWTSPDIVEVVAQFAQDSHPWIAFAREAIARQDVIS